MADLVLDDTLNLVKVCDRCGAEKSLDEFHFRRETGRHRAECKACYRKAMNDRRDPIENRRRVKAWQISNPEKRRMQVRREYRKSRTTLHGCVRKSLTCKRSDCRRSGTAFDIDVEYIVSLHGAQNGKCALTGRDLTWGRSGMDADVLSIDRIDPSGGYVPGNVRLITYQANFARNKFSDAELIRFCTDVLRCHREKVAI